jgi:hypothetical protein
MTKKNNSIKTKKQEKQKYIKRFPSQQEAIYAFRLYYSISGLKVID